MWLEAYPQTTWPNFSQIFSLVLVVVAMMISAVAFAQGVGPQYELRGSRAGILVAIGGILVYIIGTSLQSGIFHVLSIAVFYWGCVLYLGGGRSLLSTLPSGLIVVSLFAPSAYGVWGLIFLDGLSWALIVTSLALVADMRKGSEPVACALCRSFEARKESFCHSCGRLIEPLAAPSSRRLIGFAIFVAGMLAVLTLSVPLLTVTPTVSLVNFGLGGPQVQNNFAPLQGWSVKTVTLSGNESLVDEYVLTRGTTSIEAFVTSAGDPQSAASALNTTRVNPSAYSKVPTSVAQEMPGYTYEMKGTSYVGVDGVFQVGMLNDSSVSSVYLGVDLRQSMSSFAADDGSALFAAANEVIGWTSASSQWSPIAESLLYSYQTFSQWAYVCSFAGVGVILFTVARDDELAKTRRLESLHALGESESAILKAFSEGPKSLTGEQLRDSVARSTLWVSDTSFFSALDEVTKRGLVSRSIVLRRGRPTLLWRCLVS